MRRTMAIATGLILLSGVTVLAQDKAKTEKSDHHAAPAKKSTGASSAKIARAMSAGPTTVSKDATVMEMTADGKMTELKAGKNGWMCMVGPDTTPMCLDKEFQAWADAWINKKDPQIKNVGVAYMLKGDKGASNTDPYADKATPDNAWVVSGPHMMMIVPDAAQLDALPTDPWNGGPWVMWKGTPYAHIMVPTAPMPKQAAAAGKAPAAKSDAPKADAPKAEKK